MKKEKPWYIASLDKQNYLWGIVAGPYETKEECQKEFNVVRHVKYFRSLVRTDFIFIKVEMHKPDLTPLANLPETNAN